MSDKFDRLINLLRELFQLDQPDLDFGLYRIMHAKSGEVTQFLEKDLLPQVKKAFEQYQPADKAAVKKKLDEAVAAAESLGVDPDTNEKVKELRTELEAGVDLEALESEVYDHLFSFFRRYYSEGDFLAKRVYKPGVYAVPYEGEEVVLHWANKDQYYIKTSEYLRDYAFRLKPDAGDAGGDPMRVHFRLVAATEGERGNNKAAEGKDRVFVLAPAGEAGHDFLSIDTVNGREELVIGFEYRPATIDDWTDDAKAAATAAAKKKPPKQKDLINIAVKTVFACTEDPFDGWLRELEKPHTKVNGETADYSRLQGHLSRYCARHTFDYFIHRDLGGFLRREIDFYIKNEVMHLDDVQNEDAPKVEQYLSKIKVIRTIAGKVIDFLHQLEEFQRKLWLKKKFVTETSYCIRLSEIPSTFYPDIAANDAQRREWIELCCIDEVQEDLARPGYTEPLSVGFLESHPSLVVDTRHFSTGFVDAVLAGMDNLDDVTDGVVFHSENFQAVRFMTARFNAQAKCIYIDPPYNTDASAIDYKNGYKASSWMSLMADRIVQSRGLLAADGVMVAAIDDEQQRELSFILSESFDGRLLGTICVRSNPSGRPTKVGYSVSHEYLLFAGQGPQSGIGRLPANEQQQARFNQTDAIGAFEWRNLRREGSNSDRTARPALYYPIYLKDESIRVPAMEWDNESESWTVLEDPLPDEDVAWPTNDDGDEKTWRWEWTTVMSSLEQLAVRPDRAGRPYVYCKRRPHDEGVVSVSSWFDARYSATEHGTAVIKHLFGRNAFSYPKSIHAVMDAIYVAGASRPYGTVVDYFAGSGTTAHAVVNLNRADGGRRRFVLVEMGDYFEPVLLARIKKIAYTPHWNDGSPSAGATAEEVATAPRVVKVVRLESYEDALNNLSLHREEGHQELLTSGESNGLAEDYLLRYSLDVDTRGSASLLDVSRFSDPLAYRLRVRPPGSDESAEVAVDLIETFSWLLGLRVNATAIPATFSAEFVRDDEGRLLVDGRIRKVNDGDWWFRTVTGTTPDGKRALIIWRKRPGGDDPEGIEQDNAVLDAWFRTQGYSTTDSEFDVVWVNGDNNLANLRQEEVSEEGLGEAGWKVRVIEQDFHQLMFDTSDVPGGA